MIRRIGVNIPVTSIEENAQGIARETSQLIIELNDSSLDAITAMLPVLRSAFGLGATVTGVFVNPFIPIRIGNLHPIHVVGFDCVIMPQSDLLAALQIPCEQLILFSADDSKVAQLRTRLDAMERSWWHVSNQSIVGGLTHLRDLVNPIIIYDGSEPLFDILGDENTIRKAFDSLGCIHRD